MADILGQLLGFDDYIPPFASATGREILQGVNYASGSAGIRNETGSHLGNRIFLDLQLQNHHNTILRMVDLVGNRVATNAHLNTCLYIVGIGSNDYINNYLVPKHYSTNTNSQMSGGSETVSKCSVMLLENAAIFKAIFIRLDNNSAMPKMHLDYTT
uniref:Zinc finger protein n=1 Tax=Solanum tuberosum TaxID=4113 RepID=M1BU95_SOLTU